MRTTLTLEEDLAVILQKQSAVTGTSFKKIVNSAIRRGLNADSSTVPRRRVVVRPHDFGVSPGLDWNRLNQLNDELESAEYSAKAFGK